MAITRKPSAPTPAGRPDIDELINRGGSTPTGQGSSKDTEADSVAVILRIPAKMLAEVDRLVKARKVRTPRHTWLLEAIVDKVAKETSDTI